MSDDLVKRLRAFASPDAELLDDGYRLTKMCHQSHEAADRIEEAEKALANMQREYDKRGGRIEELEGQLKTILDRETSILRYYDAKLDAAEAKLAVAVEVLSAFRDFENSAFYGIDSEKNERAAYRGVKRKLLAALKILEKQP